MLEAEVNSKSIVRPNRGGATVTNKQSSSIEGLAAEVLASSKSARRHSAASESANEEIQSIVQRDYGRALRKSLSRTEVLEIVADAKAMVWPNLNQKPVRLVSPKEFTRLWSSLGVEFRLAKFGSPEGLALLGFYARKVGPARRPLICVNTAHHPAAIGAAFCHEMGHHLTARIFDSKNDQPQLLAYTAYEEHLDDPAELAADSLVSLGVFPQEIAHYLFGEFDRRSALGRRRQTTLPMFAGVLSYFQTRYNLHFDATLNREKKQQYLAATIHYAKLRRALLLEYDI